MPNQPLVSIVTCFYNEGAAVDEYFSALLPLLDRMSDFQFELVCVDDGSIDDTLARLLLYQERDNRVRVVELSRNFGKEAALTAGLDLARGQAVIPIDADLQDPPELIPSMLTKWLSGAEMVVARRIHRGSDTYLKRQTASWFYRAHNALSPVRIPQNVGDFRLIDRRVVDVLKRLPERQRFMKGLFAWVGFRCESIDYIRAPRRIGESKFSGWKLWNLALEAITSFTSLPLRIWTYIGLTGSIISFCYAFFIVTRVLVYGIDVPGYASLLVVILFLGSIQLLSIGLLGEYIGRIYAESKGRPIYIVRELHENKLPLE